MKSILFLITSVLMIAISNAEQTATQAAQAEAIRLFPDIGKPGSAANKAFLKAVDDAKRSHDPILAQPDWPLGIAKKNLRKAGFVAVRFRVSNGPHREDLRGV